MHIVNTQWFMNAAEPLIYALDWFEDGSCEFRWDYHKARGLPVVLPQPSPIVFRPAYLKLVVDNAPINTAVGSGT